jgi:hypothetical protein
MKQSKGILKGGYGRHYFVRISKFVPDFGTCQNSYSQLASGDSFG